MWEYKVINFSEIHVRVAMADALNAAGREGWELVGVTPIAAFLKRPASRREARTGAHHAHQDARAVR